MTHTVELPVEPAAISEGVNASIPEPGPPEEEIRKSRAARWLAAGGIVVAAGAVIWWMAGRGPQVTYQTARIGRGTVEAVVSATGNCNAVVTVQVGSQVSGNIQALYADFNTKVKKGQLVARIDPPIFQARVKQSRANLDAMRSAVKNAEAQIKKADADLASAQANLANQQANVAKAKVAVLDARIRLDRRMTLFNQGILSTEDRDTAQANYDSAIASQQATEASLDAAARAIQAVEAQREAAASQLATAQAQVRQSQAALEQAEADLEHTEIRAPVDGTVIARRVDVGQTVAASFQAPTIFEIAQDLTKMQVDTNVDEADIGRVAVGQAARSTVDAYPGQEFPAQVMQIRQAPINVQNVITYDVVVGVDNSDLKLLPGMTANVRILTERRENALRLPNAALRVRLGAGPAARVATKQRSAEQTVWILGSDREPKQAKVRLGISDGTVSVIEGGELNEGDAVITGVASGAAPSTTGVLPTGGGRGPRI